MKKLLFTFVLLFVSLQMFAQNSNYIYCVAKSTNKYVYVDCGKFSKFIKCEEILQTQSFFDSKESSVLITKKNHPEAFETKLNLFNYVTNVLAKDNWEYFETRTSFYVNKNTDTSSSDDYWVFRKKISDFNETEQNEIFEFLNK